MTLGSGGLYDKECEQLLRDKRADLVCLIVVKKNPKECGFSVTMTNPGRVYQLLKTLEVVTEQVRQDYERLMRTSKDIDS